MHQARLRDESEIKPLTQRRPNAVATQSSTPTGGHILSQESEKSDKTEDTVSDNDNNGSAVELDREEVPPTDITFDCPHCGKSLSIEPRGAGLVITCTVCGKAVTVPIPEGFEIDDFDASPEELASKLFVTRKRLFRAEEVILSLEEELISLKSIEAEMKTHDDDNDAFLSLLRAKLADLANVHAKAASIAAEIAKLID